MYEKMMDYELYALWQNKDYVRLSAILCKFFTDYEQDLDVELDVDVGLNLSRGNVSILIEYILRCEIVRLREFVDICVTVLRMRLMKRDLLRICRYYYGLGDVCEALRYISEIEICSLTASDVDDLLLNCPILLRRFNGIFLPYSIDHKFKPDRILSSCISDVLSVEMELCVNGAKDFLRDKEYDVIIDGENVIYSRMCSMDCMMEWIKNSFPRVRLSLHPIRVLLISRHKFVYDNALSRDIVVDTYYVSRRDDDDLYIIYSLLRLNMTASVCVYGIITNDRYGDHISRMRLSGYLADRLCAYDREGIKWCLPYSDCIMVGEELKLLK